MLSGLPGTKLLRVQPLLSRPRCAKPFATAPRVLGGMGGCAETGSPNACHANSILWNLFCCSPKHHWRKDCVQYSSSGTLKALFSDAIYMQYFRDSASLGHLLWRRWLVGSLFACCSIARAVFWAHCSLLITSGADFTTYSWLWQLSNSHTIAFAIPAYTYTLRAAVVGVPLVLGTSWSSSQANTVKWMQEL